MHARLRSALLPLAALVLAALPAVPALATPGAASLRSAEHGDTSAWSLMSTPNQGTGDNSLTGISCVSATYCAAVGSGSKSDPLTESWNGTSWSVVPNPATDSVLQGVSCVSAVDCTAVGWSGDETSNEATLVESWNGTAWSVVPGPSLAAGSNLQGVSCVSAIDCTAVGSYGETISSQDTLVESWDGTAWSVVPSPSQDGVADHFAGVSCVSAAACIAVGSYEHTAEVPVAESWNGTAWSTLPIAAKPNGTLAGVSCVSATDCTAVGNVTTEAEARSLVESWNRWWSGGTAPRGRRRPARTRCSGTTPMS